MTIRLQGISAERGGRICTSPAPSGHVRLYADDEHERSSFFVLTVDEARALADAIHGAARTAHDQQVQAEIDRRGAATDVSRG